MPVLEKSVEQMAASFYEQTPNEQQTTLRLLLNEANKSPTIFIAFLHQEQFDNLNRLPVFYQALAMDLENWADFFLAEAARLMRLAKASTTPKNILNHFAEFTFINPEKFRHRKLLLEILIPELNNTNPVFRFYLLKIVEEFTIPTDFFIIQRLKVLANDKNWRIRYLFYLLAKDSLVLGGPIKLNWLDHIRARLFNSFDIASG